jgi:hypothetical protein
VSCFNCQPDEVDHLAQLSIELAAYFLFTVGFRTKKNLRGMANDWCEVMLPYIRASKSVRFWFATHALFRDQCRFESMCLASRDLLKCS